MWERVGEPEVPDEEELIMSEAALTLLTLAGVVVLFVTNKVPVEIAAVGSALVL